MLDYFQNFRKLNLLKISRYTVKDTPLIKNLRSLHITDRTANIIVRDQNVLQCYHSYSYMHMFHTDM